MQDYKEIYREWLSNPYFDEETKAELKAIENDENEIKERFYKDLEFGTAGLRGIIGAGTNRMNKYVVRRATQGLANYLNKNFKDMEQIILAGDWNLPNTEAAKIRKAYGTRTDSQAHKDWYFSQLITRIGIRKHIEGERYTVFYTDDFNQDFISRMDSYFNRNKVEMRNPIKHEDWRVKLDSLNIRKKKAKRRRG